MPNTAAAGMAAAGMAMLRSKVGLWPIILFLSLARGVGFSPTTSDPKTGALPELPPQECVTTLFAWDSFQRQEVSVNNRGAGDEGADHRLTGLPAPQLTRSPTAASSSRPLVPRSNPGHVDGVGPIQARATGRVFYIPPALLNVRTRLVPSSKFMMTTSESPEHTPA